MEVTLLPAPLSGTIAAIPSKSHVHRLMICAALADRPVTIPCRVVSEDIEATARCVRGLGGGAEISDGSIKITPVDRASRGRAELDPGESGSTYRFFTPIAPALGRPARFTLHGKLPKRPMEDLWREMEKHGAAISGKGSADPAIDGQLTSGDYLLPGSVSSQFFTGLLFALPLLPDDSRITADGKLESVGYIKMTLDAMEDFSVHAQWSGSEFAVKGGQRYTAPEKVSAEGDWSNSAFWLCAGAAKKGITVTGLSLPSLQGDSAIVGILRSFGADIRADGNSITANPAPLHGTEIDVGDTPDLVPAIAIAAAAAHGRTLITNAGRLRLKESDRIASVCGALNALGGSARADGDVIIIDGNGALRGGTVDSCGDHRIAMLGAAASELCASPVTVTGAGAVNKSYPGFFGDLVSLGGAIAAR